MLKAANERLVRLRLAPPPCCYAHLAAHATANASSSTCAAALPSSCTAPARPAATRRIATFRMAVYCLCSAGQTVVVTMSPGPES